MDDEEYNDIWNSGYEDGKLEILNKINEKREELASDKNDDRIYWKWYALDELLSELGAG